MGWAEDRFLDHLAYEREIPKLWDRVRDSIGLTAQEFNARTKGTLNHLDHTDCTARARLCARLHKSLDGSKLEVYLDEEHRCLKTSSKESAEVTICRFRLTPDRSALEFFLEENGLIVPLSIEQACERAIGEFVFTPFPHGFHKDL